MDFISYIGGKCRKSPNQILKDFGVFYYLKIGKDIACVCWFFLLNQAKFEDQGLNFES